MSILLQRFNTTRLFVSSTGHLWLKLGGDTKWQPTNMPANDASIAELFGSATPTPLTPSSSTNNGGKDHSNHSGNQDNSMATTTILLTVIGTVVIGVGLVLAGYFVVNQRRQREYRQGEGVRSGERSSLLGASGGGGSYPPIGENDENV